MRAMPRTAPLGAAPARYLAGNARTRAESPLGHKTQFTLDAMVLGRMWFQW